MLKSFDLNTFSQQHGLGAKKVAVIGGGMVGVTTAQALLEAGCDVHVYEKGSTVALNSSFAGGGVAALGSIVGLNSTEARTRYFKQLFSSHAAAHWDIRPSLRQWGFVARLLRHSTQKSSALSHTALLNLAQYSHHCKQALDAQAPFDHEMTQGRLQLFKTSKELDRAVQKLESLTGFDFKHQVLDMASCVQVEPALASNTNYAGGIYFQQDSSANAALYTKQLKQLSAAQGVHYHFECQVTELLPEGQGWRVMVQVADLPKGAKSSHSMVNSERFDAVVFASGSDSMQLVQSMGLKLPLYPVRGYSLTLPITSLEDAPNGAILDESLQVGISRLGLRLRVSGQATVMGDALVDAASSSAGKLLLRDSATKTLSHALQTWFPYAGKLSDASYWCGTYPTLPDGPPAIGSAGLPGIYLNLGYGNNGWGLCFGGAKLIADMVTARAPEIDITGMDAQRWLKRK